MSHIIATYQIVEKCRQAKIGTEETTRLIEAALTEAGAAPCVIRECLGEPARRAGILKRATCVKRRRRTARTIRKSNKNGYGRNVLHSHVHPTPGSVAFKLAQRLGLPIRQVTYHATKGWRSRRIPMRRTTS